MWHDVEQKTNEWLDLRVGKATCSKFGVIMVNDGKAFGNPAKDYAAELAVGRITGKQSVNASYSNSQMERGHDQEPIARELYERENFVAITNGGFFDCGEYGDSPDGLAGDDGVIEIKSVIIKVHFAAIKRNKPDPTYFWQHIGHLDCTGRDWVDCVSFCDDFPDSSKLITYRIRKEDVADELQRLQIRRSEFLCLVDEIEARIRAI